MKLSASPMSAGPVARPAWLTAASPDGAAARTCRIRSGYIYYGRVGGCLITGNEDGAKHCAMHVLCSLQHLGYVIPPQADAGWVGEAGPGPSYLDPGSGGPENDFTNRNATFMTWNQLHLARMLKEAGGIPAHGSGLSGTRGAASTSRTQSIAEGWEVRGEA